MINAIKNKSIIFRVYLTVLVNHIRTHGIRWLIKKFFYRTIKEIAWVLLLPLSIFLHVLGLRCLPVALGHIGHLAADLDSHIKAKKLRLLPKTHTLYFVLAPLKDVSNPHLLMYWKEYVQIITNPTMCVFLSILTRRFFVRYDVSRYISSFFGTQEIYRLNQLWGRRPPLLVLNKDDMYFAEQIFQQLGIKKNQWHVCVHVREGGFLPHNELIQSHRNASISNMQLAMQEIIKRGGIVVRMGDPSMSPLSSSIPGVIDYAHHRLKSERLDILLCAKAKFFLGCTSGLSFVSMVFGVPVALVNMIPIEALGICHHDISIPKLLWSETQRSYLNFAEIFSSPIGGFYFSHQYKEADVRPIENTAEDILAITVEMLDRLSGQFVESNADQELHIRYMSLFKPGHYSYGAISRVCIAFLKRRFN